MHDSAIINFLLVTFTWKKQSSQLAQFFFNEYVLEIIATIYHLSYIDLVFSLSVFPLLLFGITYSALGYDAPEIKFKNWKIFSFSYLLGNIILTSDIGYSKI